MMNAQCLWAPSKQNPYTAMRQSLASYSLWLLLTVFAVFTANSFAENVSEQTLLILDPEHRMSPEQVLTRLQAADSSELKATTGFSRHEGHYWLGLNVQLDDPSEIWALRLANAHFEVINYFLYKDGKRVQEVRSGYRAETEGLHTISVDWVGRLDIDSSEQYQLVAEVASPLVSSLNVNLQTYDEALYISLARTSFLYFMIGISISLAFYNLFLGFNTREFSHILYAAHSFCGLVFIVSAYGLFRTVFGFYDHELWFYKPNTVGLQLFGTWFCYIFLQIPQRLPKLAWMFKGLMLYYVGLLLSLPFISRELFTVVSAAPHPVFGLLMIISAWGAYRNGLKPALYVFIGWVALIATSTTASLATLNLIPSFENLLMLGLCGHVFEMYMLSLAISQKFRSIQLDNISAKAANRSHTAFISYFSHEVKTPISGMLGLSKLLKQSPLNEQQNQYVEQISRTGKQLLHQLNSVLLFEAGRDKAVKHQATSLLDMLDTGVALVKGLCEDKDIDIDFLIDPNVPTVVETDPDLLQQVINNLLNNAAKYTESGEITVHCGGSIVNSDTMHIQFSVTDTGIGIPYADQDSIFHNFTQASNNTAGALVGSGMGLAIVKNISKLLDGELSFNSTPGKGSCFEFSLNVGVHRGGSHISDSLKVLVVDDVALNTEVICSLLEGAGHHTTPCVDPSQALSLAQSQRYDAILVDIHMPTMSGDALMQKIRQAGIKTAVIGISAGLTAKLSQQLQQRGMPLLMEKPFSLSVFYSLLQRHQADSRSDATTRRFDPRFIRDLASIKSAAELEDFLKRFNQSCVEQLKYIQNSVKHQQAQELATASHRLAGLSASLGLSDISQQARYLQRQAEAEEISWQLINDSLMLLPDKLKNASKWLSKTVNNMN